MVAALDFAVVTRSVGTNELVAHTKLDGIFFKESRNIPSAVEKAVGKFKAIVGLNAFHANAAASIPLDQLFQEVGRGIGRLLRIRSQIPKTAEFVNGSVPVQAFFRVGQAVGGTTFTSICTRCPG